MIAVAKPATGGVVIQGAGRASSDRIRLLVVDDHPAVRTGLPELLGDQPQFEAILAVSLAAKAVSIADLLRVSRWRACRGGGGGRGRWVGERGRAGIGVMRRDSKRRLWWVLDAGGPLWWLAGVLRSRLDAVEQAIFAMSPARIAPVEIASPSRLSESRSESRRWGMLRKLETIDVGLRTPDRSRARSAVGGSPPTCRLARPSVARIEAGRR